jgi:hypothetical protein
MYDQKSSSKLFLERTGTTMKMIELLFLKDSPIRINNWNKKSCKVILSPCGDWGKE